MKMKRLLVTLMLWCSGSLAWPVYQEPEALPGANPFLPQDAQNDQKQFETWRSMAGVGQYHDQDKAGTYNAPEKGYTNQGRFGDFVQPDQIENIEPVNEPGPSDNMWLDRKDPEEGYPDEGLSKGDPVEFQDLGAYRDSEGSPNKDVDDGSVDPQLTDEQEQGVPWFNAEMPGPYIPQDPVAEPFRVPEESENQKPQFDPSGKIMDKQQDQTSYDEQFSAYQNTEQDVQYSPIENVDENKESERDPYSPFQNTQQDQEQDNVQFPIFQNTQKNDQFQTFQTTDQNVKEDNGQFSTVQNTQDQEQNNNQFETFQNPQQEQTRDDNKYPTFLNIQQDDQFPVLQNPEQIQQEDTDQFSTFQSPQQDGQLPKQGHFHDDGQPPTFQIPQDAQWWEPQVDQYIIDQPPPPQYPVQNPLDTVQNTEEGEKMKSPSAAEQEYVPQYAPGWYNVPSEQKEVEETLGKTYNPDPEAQDQWEELIQDKIDEDGDAVDTSSTTEAQDYPESHATDKDTNMISNLHELPSETDTPAEEQEIGVPSSGSPDQWDEGEMTVEVLESTVNKLSPEQFIKVYAKHGSAAQDWIDPDSIIKCFQNNPSGNAYIIYKCIVEEFMSSDTFENIFHEFFEYDSNQEDSYRYLFEGVVNSENFRRLFEKLTEGLEDNEYPIDMQGLEQQFSEALKNGEFEFGDSGVSLEKFSNWFSGLTGQTDSEFEETYDTYEEESEEDEEFEKRHEEELERDESWKEEGAEEMERRLLQEQLGIPYDRNDENSQLINPSDLPLYVAQPMSPTQEEQPFPESDPYQKQEANVQDNVPVWLQDWFSVDADEKDEGDDEESEGITFRQEEVKEDGTIDGISLDEEEKEEEYEEEQEEEEEEQEEVNDGNQEKSLDKDEEMIKQMLQGWFESQAGLSQ